MRNPKKSFIPTAQPKYPTEIEDDYFKPLQVEVTSSFDRAMKAFRVLVQSEQVITNYKRRMSYESPSQKRRRKHKESLQRIWEENIKQEKIANGTYESEKKRKELKREKKQEEKMRARYEQNNGKNE